MCIGPAPNFGPPQRSEEARPPVCTRKLRIRVLHSFTCLQLQACCVPSSTLALISSLCVYPSPRTTSSSFGPATLRPQRFCLRGPTIARIHRSFLVSPTTRQTARESLPSLEMSSKGGRNLRHNARRPATPEQEHCSSLRLPSSKRLWQSAEGIYLCLRGR